jgi:hypothetical protein
LRPYIKELRAKVLSRGNEAGDDDDGDGGGEDEEDDDEEGGRDRASPMVA